MLTTLMILTGLTILLNASYSMLTFRRYNADQSHGGEHTQAGDALHIPLDIIVEVCFGMLMGIIGTVIMFTRNLNSISQQEVIGMTTRTYELASNQHRTYCLRDFQKTRAGAIFGSAACRDKNVGSKQNPFPQATDIIKGNATLQSLMQRPI